jgi:hypothetical protein
VLITGSVPNDRAEILTGIFAECKGKFSEMTDFECLFMGLALAFP